MGHISLRAYDFRGVGMVTISIPIE